MTAILKQQEGLYRADFEHDACGVGFIANLKGNKTHRQVRDALTMLENMEHRGACGCDPESGDGAGIMIQLPHEFLWEECISLGIQLSEPGYYGAGMAFLPKQPEANQLCREIIQRAAEDRGMQFLGFRRVPVNPDGIGTTALSVEPEIVQFFVSRPVGVKDTSDFERKLYVLRRLIAKMIREAEGLEEELYIASLSCKTIVYKGQLTTYQVSTYFPDLSDERVASAFGLVHSRFSTNTFPSWQLAQPFRMLAQNGEINTLTGNLNWFYAGLRSLSSPYFTEEE